MYSLLNNSTDIINVAAAVNQYIHVDDDIAVDYLAGYALLQTVSRSNNNIRQL